MTTFLWTVVILMAAALLAEILAFVGMAVVAMRAARRIDEIKEQVTQKVEPSIRLAKELQRSLQARMETVSREGKQIALLLATRSQSIQAAYADTNRRAERIRLRFAEGVQTVEGRQQGRRGIYREVVEPVQTASQVVRGLKLALWLFRKVA
jgi:Fe2+ transport system protein B